MAEITEIFNKRLQKRLDKRYAEQVNKLKKLGFQHMAYVAEDHGPFSALTMFNFIPPALQGGEVLVIRWPFRLTSANIVMEIADPPSLALCMGLGIKFYTIFENGSVILSSDFTSRRVPKQGSNFTRLPTKSTTQATWNLHRAEALKRSMEFDYLFTKLYLGVYAIISNFEEDPTQFDFV